MAASLTATNPAGAAFTVGGENGWQLSTDGIVDVFSYYHTTTELPSGARDGGWLDNDQTGETNQRFGVGVGLLPSVVALNIKAPTTNGVDSTVRFGLYPSIQNKSDDRFSTGSNIDMREIFYTAKGRYGEILAGRALNLFMGKNILTDMTLLTAGTVGSRANTVTLGHIGFGYLYPNFGPQIRYTTPEFYNTKFAIAVAEPYNISSSRSLSTANGSGRKDKTNTPRVEAELSYAQTYKNGMNAQGWVAGLYQRATRREDVGFREGKNVESIGGTYGIGGGYKGVNLLFSGYGGRGLGMLSAQDGTVGTGSTDSHGNGRLFWGFLAQTTYQINPSWMIGVNYGQNNMIETEQDTIDRYAGANAYVAMRKQESGVATVTYNMNKFTQFVAEYIHARQTWQDGKHQHSNQFALGTMFYW
jgi:hypothetical protein